MKKLLLIFTLTLAASSLFSSAVAARANGVDVSAAVYAENTEKSLITSAKSAYLMQAGGGMAIYAQNETKRLTIASMTKIMLLNMIFDSVERGELSYEEDVTVSENAQSMGGSQVFLQAGKTYKAKDLIKSVIISSANDASVCLAERLFGSESQAVDEMNALAEKWGLKDTLFSNVTGLPKPTQYSCAKDVAVMLDKLISHKNYFDFSTIYTDELIHPDGQNTMLTNTNKLVRFYNGCDGGKTGYTDDAGFCLAATAKRGAMRVIGVVIGEADSKTRFKDVSGLFDHAFNNYSTKILFDKDEYLDETLKVVCGASDIIKLKTAKTLYAFDKKGKKSEYTVAVDIEEKVKAPVNKGEVVGTLTVYKDGVEYSSCEIIAAETVDKCSLLQGVKKIAARWRI